jgi:hypothetical protein
MSGEITASIAAPFKRGLQIPPEEITLTVWPERFVPGLTRRRPARRKIVRSELTRPLSENSVLRARFGARRRHSALIGVIVGAVAVLGIALSLASYTADDGAPTPERSPAVLAGSDAVRPSGSSGDETQPNTYNLVTNVEIQATYTTPAPAPKAAPIAERQTYVSRDRPRVRPAKPAAPAANPAKKRPAERAPRIDENPYDAIAPSTTAPTLTAQPAVDESPY